MVKHNQSPENRPPDPPKDYLWLHLRELPYFRSLMRAVEASFYAGLDLPSPLLDVGCGAAVKSLALARAHPEVEVTCLDRPAVLEVARHLAAELDLASRTTFLPGDLGHAALEPEFYDAALLGYVTDYLRPPQNLSLLRRVHAALAPGGRLAVISFLFIIVSTPIFSARWI